tara:strand:+ start:13447 stop:14133 length:687 start_codon:yes stop_codon:yes gene_type:complete
MKYFVTIFIILLFSFELAAKTFPIPKDKKVSFDVIRKNKIIGNLTTKFIEKSENTLVLHSVLEIEVKVLLITAYKFFQETKETWKDGQFISIVGFTDFEDDREYTIVGNDKNDFFEAQGMDGDLVLDKNILPLNYWNKSMLFEKEVFDTQKGILRKIIVEKLNNEEIEIDDKKIKAEKFIFNASKNPKDKGPFPEYTLWYHNDELIKMQFKNPKDKKTILIIRNDWSQ